MRRLGPLAMAITALAILILSVPVNAWSNGGFSADPDRPDYGIHDWIADKALSFQTADVQFLLTTYHSSYLIGTEAPDNQAYIGDSYNHHVYYAASGTVQSDVAAGRARAMFQSALASLHSSDFERAAYCAGAMAHYISDLGAYGHTMGSSTEWGSSPHHGDYEDHVQDILGSLVAPVPEALTPVDPYNSTLALAQETTFGSGVIRSNTWMEANYDWGNPLFRASCLESLNESVRAVAQALAELLYEAGGYAVPEFRVFELTTVSGAIVVVLVAFCKKRSRATT